MGGQARVLVQVCRFSVSLKSGLMVVLHEDETDLSALIATSLPALSGLSVGSGRVCGVNLTFPHLTVNLTVK